MFKYKHGENECVVDWNFIMGFKTYEKSGNAMGVIQLIHPYADIVTTEPVKVLIERFEHD